MRGILLSLSFALSGLSQAASTDYFPLQVGNQWILEAAPVASAPAELLHVQVISSRTIEGRTYYLVSGYGPADLWLRKDDAGVLYGWDEASRTDQLVAHLSPQASPYRTSLSGCSQFAQPAFETLPYVGPVQFGPALPIRYSPESCRDVGFELELYGPETGLVHRTSTTIRGTQSFDLVYARVDGRVITPSDKRLVLRYDFSRGSEGWLAGFSDYSLVTGDLRMRAEVRPLPEELGERGGFFLRSMNRSDDLFMYLKRIITVADGLERDRSYRLSFEIDFASNVPTGCFGVGGSPGDSVYLKAGGSSVEPVSLLRNGADLQMNIDKGQQAAGGTDAGVTGTIANGRPCDRLDWPYVTVRRTYTHPNELRTDARGELWVLVGTDSGFEGLTELYYQSITVRLTPTGQGGAGSSR